MGEPEHKTPEHHGTPHRGRSISAVIALVLAIIGLLLSPVPIINNFAFLIAALALIAGIVGIVGTRRNRRKGRSMATVSVVLAVLACVIVLASQAFYGNALDSAGKQADKEIKTSTDNASGKNTDQILGKDIDVTIGKFAVSTPDEFTTDTVLPVKVTNKNDKSASYSIQIEAVDASGTRIDDDTVYVNDLGTNQAQNFKAFQYPDPDKIEALKAAKFRVASVSMY